VVGDLLIDTSKKRQVIVETHSAHMINRARIAVAKGEIRPEHLIIHYVYRTDAGSRVVTIPVGPEGQFLEKWPSGFFDERYEDTKTLLQLKGK
jgi:predicted ATPase